MWKNFLFKRRNKYTKFDLYIFLGVLFLAVLYERPEQMWLYLAILICTVACLIYLNKGSYHNPLDEINSYTKSVPKEFVKDKNTLGNLHCIAKYFSAQNKIVVMDHPELKTKSELRSFEVTKDNIGDVEKTWKDICSVFDEYTFFETLFSYIDKNSGVLKLNYINRVERIKAPDKEVHDYSKLSHPEPTYDANALVLSEYGDPLINIEKLDKKEVEIQPYSTDEEGELIEMDSILNTEDGKIDINIANAEKIATLPGINIVKAKKIVEYRNINGFFKTKEDFCKVAGIKEHFKPQVLEQITVDKTSKIIVEDPRRRIERIVD